MKTKKRKAKRRKPLTSLTTETHSRPAKFSPVSLMPREIIILECTEARAAGVNPSRYVTTRNKKSVRTPGRLEKVKFNPAMKKRTLHRELR